MKFRFALILLAVLGGVLPAQNKLELYPVKGEEYVEGLGDLVPSLTWEIRDNKLLLEIVVNDDRLVVQENPLLSDHVDLWFAHEKMSSQVFEVDGELYAFYPEGDETFVEGWNDLMDLRHLSDTLSEEDVELVHDLTGMVHYTIDLKSKRVILRDEENYEIMAPDPGLPRYIDCRVTVLRNGYRIWAEIDQKALGFRRGESLASVLTMVDVYDSDDNDGHFSLYSTNSSWKWGDSHNFTDLPWSSAQSLAGAHPICEFDPDQLLYLEQGSWIPFSRIEYNYHWASPVWEILTGLSSSYSYSDTTVEEIKIGMVKLEKPHNPFYVEFATFYEVKGHQFRTEVNEYTEGGLWERVNPNRVKSKDRIYLDDQFELVRLGGKKLGTHAIEKTVRNGEYGTGPCATCVVGTETFSVIDKTGARNLLEIHFEEENGFSIGDKPMNGEFQGAWWIPGKPVVEVIWLDEKENRRKCRVSWNGKGKQKLVCWKLKPGE